MSPPAAARAGGWRAAHLSSDGVALSSSGECSCSCSSLDGSLVTVADTTTFTRRGVATRSPSMPPRKRRPAAPWPSCPLPQQLPLLGAAAVEARTTASQSCGRAGRSAPGGAARTLHGSMPGMTDAAAGPFRRQPASAGGQARSRGSTAHGPPAWVGECRSAFWICACARSMAP